MNLLIDKDNEPIDETDQLVDENVINYEFTIKYTHEELNQLGYRPIKFNNKQFQTVIKKFEHLAQQYLQTHGFVFIRENFVSFYIDRYANEKLGGTYSRIDFVVKSEYYKTCIFFLEVDEEGHQKYNPVNEKQRTKNIESAIGQHIKDCVRRRILENHVTYNIVTIRFSAPALDNHKQWEQQFNHVVNFMRNFEPAIVENTNVLFHTKKINY
jgi:hypothetical protein